jgi:hypothetical protein
MPGNPVFPELPVDLTTLARNTRHLPTRTGVSTEEKQAALQEMQNNPNPAFQVQGSVYNNALFVTALSAQLGASLSDADIRGYSTHSPSGGIGAIMPSGIQFDEDGHSTTDAYGQGPQFGFARSQRVLDRVSRSIENLSLLQAAPRGVMSPSMQRLMTFSERMLSVPFRTSWEQIEQQISSPLLRSFAHIYDATPIHYRAYSNFITNNIRLPLDFFITRPHITLVMLMGIKMWRGRETMFTVVQPGLFEMEDDAKTQAHLGTFTWKHKCIVKEPANVYIAKGIFINGYKGGLGTNPINPSTYDAGSGTYDNESIITIPIPVNDRLEGNLLSLTGRLTVAEFDSLGLADHMGSKYQFESASRVQKMWGFNNARISTNYDTTPADVILDRQFNNVLCLPGLHLKKNIKDDTYTVLVRGQGHLAGMIYPGCGEVLAGRMTRVDQHFWQGYIQA